MRTIPISSRKSDKDTPRTHENVSLYIEDAQTQTEAGVLNGNMVGMYASATLAEGQNTVLTFTPIASLIAFNIYDAENNGDAVKSITFTPAGGEKLNGQHIYNLETGETTSTGTKESCYRNIDDALCRSRSQTRRQGRLHLSGRHAEELRRRYVYRCDR